MKGTTWEKAFRLPTLGVNVDELLCDAELASIEAAKIVAAKNVVNGWKRELCDCPETRINGVRYALHRPIDHEYARERSKLVDAACRRASKKVGELPADADRKTRDSHAHRFTAVFNREMDRLAAPLLRQQSSNGASPPSSEAQSDIHTPSIEAAPSSQAVNSGGDDATRAAGLFA